MVGGRAEPGSDVAKSLFASTGLTLGLNYYIETYSNGVWTFSSRICRRVARARSKA
jgi:hypothetical protein